MHSAALVWWSSYIIIPRASGGLDLKVKAGLIGLGTSFGAFNFNPMPEMARTREDEIWKRWDEESSSSLRMLVMIVKMMVMTMTAIKRVLQSDGSTVSVTEDISRINDQGNPSVSASLAFSHHGNFSPVWEYSVRNLVGIAIFPSRPPNTSVYEC